MKRLAAIMVLGTLLAVQARAEGLNPPLDRTLHYETVQVRGAGAKTQKITSKDDLRFTRTSSGYALTWTSASPVVEAPPPTDALLRAVVQAAVEQPMTIRFDKDGAVEGVEKLSQWRTKRAELLETAFNGAIPPAAKAALQPMLDSIRAGVSAQTDEQLVQELTDTPAYLTIGAAAGLRPGEQVSIDTQLPLSIGSGSIPAKLTIAGLTAAPDGQARLSLVSVPDPASLSKAVTTMLAAILASLPAEAQAAAQAELKSAKLSLEDKAEITYDPATGLSSAVIRLKKVSWGKALAREERTELHLIR